HDLHGQRALLDRTGALMGFRIAFRADLTARLCFPETPDSVEGLHSLRAGCEYWFRNIHGDQLAAAPTSSLLRHFLLLLKRFRIPATALSVRASPPESKKADVAGETVTAIQAAFGMSVPIVPTGTRAGRAAAYLLISLNSKRPCLRGHGASMLWFHSVMLAAWVWLEHLKENSIAV
ncbi:MAG: hypothetical protein JWN34_5923, partial [Bryobacterales bacterium]|nr:hypothetical protein [Bryobacterales bacterium]